MTLLSFHYSLLIIFFNDPATTDIYTLSLHDALPIFFLGGATQTLDAASVLFVRAVGEIQPRHIHTQPQQLAYRRFRVGGRTDRADDLRPTACDRCDALESKIYNDRCVVARDIS